MQVCTICGKVHEGRCPGSQAGVVAEASPANMVAGQPPGAAITDPGGKQQGMLAEGQVLQDRYQILEIIGQGGMGTVFMAKDLRLKGRPCVVKKLRDDFYREEDRQKAQEFFEREMQVLSQLRHMHIVQILDFFAEGNDYFLVMEYVQGGNLYHSLTHDRHGQPYDEKTVVEWSQQIAEVLHYMHSQTPPVVYRDLKPSNVMIDFQNVVKLVDFGIARPSADTGEHTHVVSAGYSPPEQYWGAVDPRADIYALGATMYFLLTGRDPDQLNALSPRSINPQVGTALDRIVRRCTAQNIDERYQTVEELMEALMHYDFVEPPNTPRSRIAEIVTGLIILALATIIFLVEPMLQSDPKHASDKPGSGTPPQEVTQPGYETAGAGAQQDREDQAAEINDEKDLMDQSPPAGSHQKVPGKTSKASAGK